MVFSIVDDWDLILVVGSERVEFRVYSKILTISSPTFAAMLNGNYQEGQALGTSDSTKATVALPEDDPKTLEVILRVLHHQDSQLQKIEASQLLNIAVAANKYLWAPALRYAFYYWERTTPDPNFQASCDILAAAYLLDSPQTFHVKS